MESRPASADSELRTHASWWVEMSYMDIDGVKEKGSLSCLLILQFVGSMLFGAKHSVYHRLTS
jgi:hypothetical protein